MYFFTPSLFHHHHPPHSPHLRRSSSSHPTSPSPYPTSPPTSPTLLSPFQTIVGNEFPVLVEILIDQQKFQNQLCPKPTKIPLKDQSYKII